MKAKSATVKLPARARAPEYLLGVDGGGTKTHAVIADEHGRVLGEGFAGPSNPLRVGVNSAAAAVREAVDQACDAAGGRRAGVVAAGVGVAGGGGPGFGGRRRGGVVWVGLRAGGGVADVGVALYCAANGRR